MASLLDSTFDPDSALRECYLYQLRPQERDLLSRLSHAILELAREGHQLEWGNLAPTFHHVQAVAADLRFLESLLRHISSYKDEASHYLWHARLLVLASQIAPKVGELAGELEAELQAVAGAATHE